MPNVDYGAVKEQIKQWCGEENLTHQEKESEKDHFLLFINYPLKSHLKILVYAPKDAKDAVYFGSSLLVNSDKFKDAYKKMGKHDMEEFKYAFYSQFLLAPAESTLKFNEDKTPERIDVVKKTWLKDELPKKDFMETLETVTKCREAARYFCLGYFHIYSDDIEKETLRKSKEATREYIR